MLAALAEPAKELPTSEILGAIARGWCHPRNQHKVMDADLADAIGDEIGRLMFVHKVKLSPPASHQPNRKATDHAHEAANRYAAAMGIGADCQDMQTLILACQSAITAELAELREQLAAAQCGHAVLVEQLKAKHPADDEEPISEEWLRAVGWKSWDTDDKEYNQDKDVFVRIGEWCGWENRLAFTQGAIWAVRMNDEEPPDGWSETVQLIADQTRGDVRRLCKCLGIELKEKP
jgi:hypothetical protein